MKKNIENQFPHNGELLKKIAKEEGLNYVALGKRMNMHPSSFAHSVKSESLQMRHWWKLGLALDRNLIAEIGESFPLHYETLREKELQSEIETLKSDIEKLKLELGIYKRILEESK